MRAGIYDAYLSTLGGGENLLAGIAEVLEEELPAYAIDIITHGTPDVDVGVLNRRFKVNLERAAIRSVPSRTRRWMGRWAALPFDRFYHERDVARISEGYELFVNNTIFSLAPPRSALSVYVCMFPLDPRPHWAESCRWPSWLLESYVGMRQKCINRWISQYTLVVSISQFTRAWAKRLWGVDSEVLYPPVSTEPSLNLKKKRKKIIAIGRFFPGNHNKKHEVLVRAFRSAWELGLSGWELHLVGGRTAIPGTEEYIRNLKCMASDLPIHFHLDASPEVLDELCGSASLFWHATGYGEDPESNPYKLEHFGISTVEAMSYGCVPLVHACGGQLEVIRDGVSGVLWKDVEDLVEASLELASNGVERERMAREAHEHSKRFSRSRFRDEARRVLACVLERLERGTQPVDEALRRCS